MQHRPVLVAGGAETRLHRKLLRHAGHTVVRARTGEEAIWKVHREHPCLVVVSCAVPGVSGIRAAEVLKGDSVLRAVPVLLLGTPDGRDEEAARAREAGCDRYLPHGSSAYAVLRAVRTLVPRVRPLRAAEPPPRPRLEPGSGTLAAAS